MTCKYCRRPAVEFYSYRSTLRGRIYNHTDAACEQHSNCLNFTSGRKIQQDRGAIYRSGTVAREQMRRPS